MNPTKIRLDKFLLENGLASTRAKAQELIRGEKVLLDGKVCVQTGKLVGPNSRVELLSAEHPYVSRGGVKLAGALRDFSLDVTGITALDLGQSTGGFTECLLLQGALEVFGVDVGHSQLHPTLRAHPKVKFWEKTDIRALSADAFARQFSLVVADLSFISIEAYLPALCKFLEPNADVVVLLKPQFEVDPALLGGGGILRNEKERLRIIEARKQFCRGLGFTVAGVSDSKVAGGDGNQETFLHLKWPSSKIGF